MIQSIMPYFWLFIIYSFTGWCIEAVETSVREKKFINRGVLDGPICPVYGIIFVMIHIFLRELSNRFFFLGLGSAVLAMAVLILTGRFLKAVLGKKWWDFSKYKYNIEGYVKPTSVVFFALAGIFSVKFLNPLLMQMYSWLPSIVMTGLMLAVSVIVGLDIISTYAVLLKWKGGKIPAAAVAKDLQGVTAKLGNRIFYHVQRRVHKAYPETKEMPVSKPDDKVFASGCGFYKLVWLFFIGAFMGDIIETIFCYVTMGEWMSRSSVVYGPFSIVWGLGGVLLTSLLYRLKDREDRYLFFAGTLVGGVYEYICSVFTEIVFGTVFWDYSDIPFNLGGRINLLYCFFWGFAALTWMKWIYPKLSDLIEKIPKKAGRIITWMMIIFMLINIAVSTAAMARYDKRYNGQAPENEMEKWLDRHFDDNRMRKIYPNAIKTS